MIPCTGPLAATVAAARTARDAWMALPARQRNKVFQRVPGIMEARAEELSRIISEDCGKSLIDALSAEVLPATMAAAWYRKKARHVLKTRSAPAGEPFMMNKRSRMISHPWGVVGIVSPWNYPFSIPFSEVVMALVTGNAVILKVASNTPKVGGAIVDIFRQAGLPEGVLVQVEMPGAQAGPAMIDGGVDKLFFTGSVPVGMSLMAEASRRLLPLSLELGGNDAAVVCSDADLQLAARGIVWAGLSNAGQSCGGAQRILVHASVMEEFSRILSQQVADLRLGHAHELDNDVAAMINPRQKAAVTAQVDASVALGARILCKGQDGPADTAERAWMAPVVLTDITRECPVWKDEVFGPVMALMPWQTEDEAVTLANDSVMGLTASVWSRSASRGRRIASRIHAGAVMVNDHLMSHGLAETPWGGVGHSGLGRTHGIEGLREMVWNQVVVSDILPGRRRNPWWHPHSAATWKGLRAMQSLRFAPGLGDRIRAIPALLGLFFTYWKK